MAQIMQKVYKYHNDDVTPEGFDPFSEIIKDGLNVIKIGIQAPSGTEFSINNSSVIMGDTGFLELDNTINLQSLIFTKTSNLKNIIIDILYEEGGEV